VCFQICLKTANCIAGLIMKWEGVPEFRSYYRKSSVPSGFKTCLGDSK